MNPIRKILSLMFSLLLLLPLLAVPVQAAPGKADTLIQEILGAMEAEQTQAQILPLVKKLEKEDARLGGIWNQILESWYYCREELTENKDVLPDGLPQDDSLAIVVLGLQLNDNGSIKPELLDRLAVTIRSARKYPNAYIVCTGGATSKNDSMTEAGEMAKWLTICGIDESRIIVEDASYSTTENARNTCEILEKDYPAIQSLALVTSDYHLQRSFLMFKAAALYAADEGKTPLNVTGSAVCTVANAQEESIRTQVWGLAILAGVDMPE